MCAARGADLAVFVDFEFLGAHEPVGFADIAGGVIAVEYAVLVVAFHFDAFGVAVAARGIDLHLVGGFFDRAAAAVELHAHFRAFEHVAALLEPHIAARAHLVFGLVITQPVGIDGLAAPAQAHGAFSLEFAVLVALQVVGIDKQGQRAGIVGRQAQQGRLQLQLHVAIGGFQAECRTVGGGDCGSAEQQRYGNQS